MKKVVLSLVLFAGVIAVSAQPRAIGVRFGYSTEVSYQHSLGSNMIQIDAGFPAFNSFQVVGTYNWIIPVSSWKHAGSWNLYTGVGAGAGIGWYNGYYLQYHGDYNYRYFSRVYGVLGVAGMFGAEYNFKFPLQVFADYRPLIGIALSNGEVWFHERGLYSIGIGARYRFPIKK